MVLNFIRLIQRDFAEIKGVVLKYVFSVKRFLDHF